ncbi:MAG: PEP-utilizing enzyme, partial [Pseudonocardiales bacterium]|nr:PEP-utilizing enzyme [Pseudonocardiales bacterium]
ISAAWGLGESVVGGTVSTDDHVVDRTSWAVVSRHVADKTEMTVPVDGGTAQRPVPAGRRRGPVLDDAAAVALARLGVRVEEHFGAPQDVEWAREGDTFHIVQSRPVTALPEPTGDVPTTWPVPYPGGLFFRASIVEQLPDPLTPLFADLIDGSVARSLGALMAEVMGEDVLAPGDVGMPTVNGYAYHHYRPAVFRRILRRTPAAAAALFGRDARARATAGGVTGWRERSRPRYRAALAARSGTDPATLSPAELLAAVEELLDAGTVYYTAVQSVIPQAVTSELAFRAFHDRVVRRPGEPDGVGFLLGLDSEPLRAERSLYDLATSAARDPALAAVLSGAEPAALLRALRDGTVPEGAEPAAWEAWAGRWRRHLGHYGHTVYNLDFAEPVPADDPAPLLDAVRFHLGGGGTDPRERQRRTARRREARTRAVRARLGPVRRAVFDRLLRAAQEIGPVREDALAEMGLAWPVMRRMLRELGRRLVGAGVLADPDEVFWLTRDEVRRAVAGERPDVAAAIAGRRAQWRGRRRAVPPQVLPESGLVHRLIRPWLPAVDRAPAGPVLSGVAAGTGSVTAPARVLDGPADFPAMRPGEVLVARITTPAWTPLFARAAAVVTDVGGPLSHGSVVAREYGIPAVLGTGSATSRIRTGQDVRVDGDAGTVTLLDGPAGGDTGGGDTAGGDGPGDGGGPDAGGTRVLLAATAAVGVAVTAACLRSRRGARGGRRSDP